METLDFLDHLFKDGYIVPENDLFQKINDLDWLQTQLRPNVNGLNINWDHFVNIAYIAQFTKYDSFRQQALEIVKQWQDRFSAE